MISRQQMVDSLSKTALFGPLSDSDRRAVAEELREATFVSGQSIFARGDPGRDIYLVTEGRVRLSVLTAEGRELSFAHAEPGAIFGEIATLDGGARTADATAVAKTVALTLSKASLKRLMLSSPSIGEAAIQFLCARVREADQQLEAIALYPIEARLARFFLAAARARSPEITEGSVMIDMAISQTELAMLIGASRPKVNAALALLEDQGAVERRDGARLNCDLDELRAIAGVD